MGVSGRDSRSPTSWSGNGKHCCEGTFVVIGVENAGQQRFRRQDVGGVLLARHPWAIALMALGTVVERGHDLFVTHANLG